MGGGGDFKRLRCFAIVLGLKINLLESNLIGVGCSEIVLGFKITLFKSNLIGVGCQDDFVQSLAGKLQCKI